MAGSVDEIDRACAHLRAVQADVLAQMSQAEVVDAVCAWADAWREPSSPWRREAEALKEPFSFAMTRVSFEGLLASLEQGGLWALIDGERVRDLCGAPLIAHVASGNIPLVSWVSLLRALLMRSASFVKLPSGAAGDWGRLFLRSLGALSPPLASSIRLAQWPGGTRDLDAALCRNADLVLGYGGSQAMEALKVHCAPATPFLGYGPRVSFAVIPTDTGSSEAAQGLAQDILLYDQGGCLSPHTVFVEGDASAAVIFAALLADVLGNAVGNFPQAPRPPQAAFRVREARQLARMEPATTVWGASDLRWTVVARPTATFAPSPTHGIISVQPLEGVGALATACRLVAGYLQGCAVAVPADEDGFGPWKPALEALGISRVCRPGDLQAPPLSWREDGRDVLRSLLG